MHRRFCLSRAPSRLHHRFPARSNPISASIRFLQFLTASRVARNASPEEERPLAKRVKRGGACLCAHDLSSRQLRVPGHPQGYWLAETCPALPPRIFTRNEKGFRVRLRPARAFKSAPDSSGLFLDKSLRSCSER